MYAGQWEKIIYKNVDLSDTKACKVEALICKITVYNLKLNNNLSIIF